MTDLDPFELAMFPLEVALLPDQDLPLRIFEPRYAALVRHCVDTGDAFSTFGDYRQKVGVGVGARWRSPVGMVRVDLGFPVHDDAHHGVELHIVIGPDL